MRAILIIDDDPDVRSVLSGMIDANGDFCVTAENGPLGLAVYQQMRFDAVIVDMRMPGMSGPEVISELKEINPDVRIVAVAGEGSLAPAPSPNLIILQQPFELAPFIAALDTVLR